VIACDEWTTIKQNMRAIGLTVAALRGLDRWGCTDMVKRVFVGLKALPAPGETSGATWWDLLGIERTASELDIKAAFRQKAKQHHPDMGGTHAEFSVIKRAYEQALAAVFTKHHGN